MTKATYIADTLGRAAIADALGVTVDAVSVNLRRGGCFPPAWFPVLRDMCSASGIDCPESAFNWKSPSATAAPNVDATQ